MIGGKPINETNRNQPVETILFQNDPDPFESETVINFQISCPGPVELKIFNHLGQEVRTLAHSDFKAGTYEITRGSEDNRRERLPAGTYH
jgi:hypothetical protein